MLRPQTQTFFKELFTHLFISSQVSGPLPNASSSDPSTHPSTKNRGPIEEIFIKASKIQALAMGLVYFLGETFKRGEEDGPLVKWASGVARDTLRTGIDVVSSL